MKSIHYIVKDCPDPDVFSVIDCGEWIGDLSNSIFAAILYANKNN